LGIYYKNKTLKQTKKLNFSDKICIYYFNLNLFPITYQFKLCFVKFKIPSGLRHAFHWNLDDP